MNIAKEIEQAVLHRDIDALILLKLSEFDWNFKDEFGRTVIFDAVVKGYPDIVEFLCKTNINVNHQDDKGKSPLHFAAIHRQLEIARILLMNEADVNLRDHNGNTPLFDAVFNCQGDAELVSLFIDNGADYLTANDHGVSPRKLAETIVNFDITQLFSNNS